MVIEGLLDDRGFVSTHITCPIISPCHQALGTKSLGIYEGWQGPKFLFERNGLCSSTDLKRHLIAVSQPILWFGGKDFTLGLQLYVNRPLSKGTIDLLNYRLCGVVHTMYLEHSFIHSPFIYSALCRTKFLSSGRMPFRGEEVGLVEQEGPNEANEQRNKTVPDSEDTVRIATGWHSEEGRAVPLCWVVSQSPQSRAAELTAGEDPWDFCRRAFPVEGASQ